MTNFTYNIKTDESLDTKNKPIEIIKKMSSIHINDPMFSHYFDQIVNCLSQNENEFIEIIA